jgi:alpha-tubulin suppressor-like RCC1 family protein
MVSSDKNKQSAASVSTSHEAPKLTLLCVFFCLSRCTFAGQLGHGVRLDERFPRKVEAERSKMGNFVRVACGDRHTAVVNDAGKVVTFGSGQHGQLGHGNGSDQLRPVMVSEGPLASQVVVSIDCGATTTAAVTSTGLFYLWGFGESIHPKGCSNIQDCPRLVKIKEPVKQVACGQAHVLVLTDAGDVYAFGEASMGQLGHGSRSNVRNPRLVLRGKEIHQIDAGRYHSMAVSAYGVLYSWGCGGQFFTKRTFPRACSSDAP